MTVSPLAAAKRLCEKSGWSISNLELQKLLYIAHMFYLGRTGAPLISGHFEAWDYGPVHPALYHRAKVFGSSPVRNVFRMAEELIAGDEVDVLDETIASLSNAPPGKLVAITHWEDGAWAKHYSPGSRSAVIPNDDIRQEYLDRADALRRKRA